MCWSSRGKTCSTCQAIFDACEHETTFTNRRKLKQCSFCEKVYFEGKWLKMEVS